MTDQEAIEQIKDVLGVNTLIDGLRKLREWREVVKVRPVVWTDDDNNLRVAPLTVRQTVQLIAALEGLQVR
jgi:hypothetical protein